MDTLQGLNGRLKREKSPLRYQHRLSADGAETLSEVSLDDTRHLSDADTDAASALHPGSYTPATSGPPELPPRKRGSASSASSGVLTPPVPPAPSLPPRRGPFGWLRSASTSAKSPPAPSLPPRTSMASVNYAPAALPNIDLLIARLEEQSKMIKEGDEKIREEYAVGND